MFQKGFEKSDDRFSRIFQGFTRKFCCHDELQTIKHFAKENPVLKISHAKNRKVRKEKKICQKNSAQATTNSTKSKSV